MKIVNCTKEDIEIIFSLYDAAIAFQKTVFDKHWLGFDEAMVENEINENRQYKIMIGNTVVCIFVLAFNGPYIWGEKDKNPSVYIHRIVTHPQHRGNGYVKNITAWALEYGRSNGKKFVRMDTWGDNQKLIDYYTACGFTFLGLTGKLYNSRLPKHYEGIQLSLF